MNRRIVIAIVLLFAAAALARNKLQKIETHNGVAAPGVVTIKGGDFQVATGGSDGDCLKRDSAADAGVSFSSCSSGGGDNVSVDSAPTVDPDFQDGDVDFTYAAGVVTATVACTGCVDATDLATDSCAADEIASGAVGTSEIANGSIAPADLDFAVAPGAGTDEYCVTYEHSTTEFELQVCSSGGGDSITVNSSAVVDPDFANSDIDFSTSFIGPNHQITATVACTGCIDATDIATDAVAADEIAAGAVGSSEIANADYGDITVAAGVWTLDVNTVHSIEIADGEVGSNDIATSAVGSDEISANAVGNSEMADNAVGTAEIIDESITPDDLDVINIEADGDLLGFDTANGLYWYSPQEVACYAWPVGSIYISINSTDPATTLGCGTWTAFATGRTLVGIDSGRGPFDADEETGGTWNHTHTYTQVPNHTHPIAAGQGSHQHGMAEGQADGAGTFMDRSNAASATTAVTDLATLPAMVTSDPTSGVPTGTTATPSDEPVEYIVVRFWKRTA